jgi:hypothetical protein
MRLDIREVKERVGIIILNGRASLQLKGSISELERAIVGIGELQKAIGAEILMIEIVPLPESSGIVIAMNFKGSFEEFERVIVGLEKLRDSVAIDTVPLPNKPMIGTWPTPEKPKAPLQWAISVRSTPNTLK